MLFIIGKIEIGRSVALKVYVPEQASARPAIFWIWLKPLMNGNIWNQNNRLSSALQKYWYIWINSKKCFRIWNLHEALWDPIESAHIYRILLVKLEHGVAVYSIRLYNVELCTMELLCYLLSSQMKIIRICWISVMLGNWWFSDE